MCIRDSHNCLSLAPVQIVARQDFKNGCFLNKFNQRPARSGDKTTHKLFQFDSGFFNSPFRYPLGLATKFPGCYDFCSVLVKPLSTLASQ